MRRSAEFDLIAAIRERLAGTASGERPTRILVGIGDDAAVTEPRGVTATSVDATIDGVHFRLRWCPPATAGRKALATALSDLAAMGAEPGEAYVWLGIPEGYEATACLELCDGIGALATETGVAVIGGDLGRAPVLSICVTAVGHAERAEDLVGRGGAEAGDALCVTGSLGGAAAGLVLLEHPELRERIGEEAYAAATDRQLRPWPQLGAGQALARSGARAMIDVSDGLGADAEHLAAASGLGIELELASVPVAAGVRELAAESGRDPEELVAGGGEDYELLCAVPRPALEASRSAVEEAGTQLTEIGRFVTGAAVRLRLPGGRSVPASGHDQLD